MYQHDSRNIQPGDIYIGLPKGERYIKEALERGAVGYSCMTRKQAAQLAMAHYKDPSQKCCVIGITGTNGKTTVSTIVEQVLKKCGYSPYVQGTLTHTLTMPESVETLSNMATHVARGGTHFIMEVSSHGITQGRHLGIDFQIKCLTNITQDHLDYHQTLDAYKNTKLSFMKEGDRKEGEPQTIYPEDYLEITQPISSPLIGDFNLENLKAAMKICQYCGISDQEILEAFKDITAPPGRFELIQEAQSFSVIVDYAHTPDGLEHCLKESKKIAQREKGRLIAVFGCGGDRDRGKRPLMGQISETYADISIVTQDNPRTENQDQIIEDILNGFQGPHPLVIHNREEAIHHAIAIAQEKDVIMIAGKGHETVQIIGKKAYHSDDRELARDAIRKRE